MLLKLIISLSVILTHRYTKLQHKQKSVSQKFPFAGNRWIVSIWSATPHKQPPLDFTELEANYQPVHYVHPYPDEYREVHKREEVPASFSQQPLTTSQEYLELHKRESDI